METTNQQPKKGRGRTILRILFFLILAGLVALGAVLLRFGRYDDQKLHNDPQTTLVYDAKGELALSAHGTQDRVAVPIGDIPQDLRNAVLAAEDLRFYDHIGFDVIRIFGALWADIRTGSLDQGASTITQQLVKNTHLTPEKTWTRKLQEAYYAFQIERDYSKDDILAMYMNHVYLGNGAYGVQAAARAYFGVDVGELSLEQSVAIAAILKAPTNYAPHIEPENNERRRKMILATMLAENMIAQDAYDAAVAAELTVLDREGDAEHGWFTDAALEDASALLGVGYDEMLSGGYRIHTTMDTALQEAYEALFTGDYFPPDAADGEAAQAALTALEPRTGAVRALIGGRAYTARRQLNRATQMRRQPGSTLKPFAVYAPAIERAGLTTTSFFNDQPTDFDGYSPKNFGDTYRGWVTSRTALARSLNIPAVLIMNQTGVGLGREYCAAFGLPLEDGDMNLSLALGYMTRGVSPLELTSAYAALGNGGEYLPPYTVEKIYDASGNLVYEHEHTPHRAVDENTAFLLTDMLTSAASWGSGQRIGKTGLTVAAKTGTVAFEGELNRDAWAAAYTPKVALSVWMGFDTTDAAHAMEDVTGGTLPSQLAAEALKLAQEEDAAFTQPPGVERAKLDKRELENNHIALLATEWTPPSEVQEEWYVIGTGPAAYGSYWVLPHAPSDLRVEMAYNHWPQISFTSLDENARYRLYRTASEGEPVEVAAVRAPAGEVIRFTDNGVEPAVNYQYFVVPEHAEAVDMGVAALGTPTYTAGVTMPMLPMDLPFNLDDLFFDSILSDDDDTHDDTYYMEQDEAAAADNPAPSESPSAATPNPAPTPAATPEPTPEQTQKPTSLPTPTATPDDSPLFGLR